MTARKRIRHLLPYLLLLISSSVSAKPASLIIKNEFSSDPYYRMAQFGDYYVVTTREGTGSPRPGKGIEVLTFEDNQFAIVSQEYFTDGTADYRFDSVADIVTKGEYLLLLGEYRGQMQVASATIETGHLQILHVESFFGRTDNFSRLLNGPDNNFYVLKDESAVSVRQFRLLEDGSFEVGSSTLFGTLAFGEVGSGEYVKGGSDGESLILVNNGGNKPSDIYQQFVDEQGNLAERVQLTFPDSQQDYESVAFDGQYVYMSYIPWGFQVAKLDGDTLTEVFSFEETSNFQEFVFSEDRLYAIDTFSTVDVFDISDKDNISHLQSFRTKGFSSDAVITEGKLIVTQGWEGVSAQSIGEDTLLSPLSQFAQSGEASDFSSLNDLLFTNAADNALNIWQRNQNNEWEFLSRFDSFNSLGGVLATEDGILLHESGGLVQHALSNLISNINSGSLLGPAGGSGRRSTRVIPLDNGTLSWGFNDLIFYDENFNVRSEVEIERENFNSGYVQPPLANGDRLYVPVNTAPAKILIYDISDLSDVQIVGEINRRRNAYTGAVAAKDNYLYVPEVAEDFSSLIDVYDVSDLDNIELVGTTSVQGERTTRATLNIVDEYLVYSATQGHLFSISDRAAPVFIETNISVSSNGIAESFDNQIFAVVSNTASRTLQAEVNLAPIVQQTEATFTEDVPSVVGMQIQDPEQDTFEIEVTSEPQAGELTVSSDNILKYAPSQNFFGEDNAVIRVSDVNGSFVEVPLQFTVLPVNDAPEVSEEALSFTEDMPSSVQIPATDVEEDDIQFTLIDNAQFGQAELTAEGVLTYSPDTDFSGADSVTVQLSDDNNATATYLIQLDILPVNDAPVYTGEVAYEGREDESFTLSFGATDVDSSQLSFGFTELPADWSSNVEGEQGTVTPAQDAFGEFTLVVSVNDGEASTTQEVTVNLLPVNDTPTVPSEEIAASVVEGRSANVTLPVNDVDGDALSYELVTPAQNGQASISESGVLTYEANAGATGTETLVVIAADPSGASVEFNVVLTFTAAPVVQPPASSSGSGGGASFLLSLLAMLVMAIRSPSSNARVNRA